LFSFLMSKVRSFSVNELGRILSTRRGRFEFPFCLDLRGSAALLFYYLVVFLLFFLIGLVKIQARSPVPSIGFSDMERSSTIATEQFRSHLPTIATRHFFHGHCLVLSAYRRGFLKICSPKLLGQGKEINFALCKVTQRDHFPPFLRREFRLRREVFRSSFFLCPRADAWNDFFLFSNLF